MSEENVEIVRRLFDAFQEGRESGDPGKGFDADLLAENAEWVPFPGGPVPQSGFRGREGFLEFMRTWTEDFEDWSIDYEQLLDAPGDRVVALVTQSATGKGSGVRVDQPFARVYELEDGRVIRTRNFVDPAQAFEAADFPRSSEVALWTASAPFREILRGHVGGERRSFRRRNGRIQPPDFGRYRAA